MNNFSIKWAEPISEGKDAKKNTVIFPHSHLALLPWHKLRPLTFIKRVIISQENFPKILISASAYLQKVSLKWLCFGQLFIFHNSEQLHILTTFLQPHIFVWNIGPETDKNQFYMTLILLLNSCPFIQPQDVKNSVHILPLNL